MVSWSRCRGIQDQAPMATINMQGFTVNMCVFGGLVDAHCVVAPRPSTSSLQHMQEMRHGACSCASVQLLLNLQVLPAR